MLYLFRSILCKSKCKSCPDFMNAWLINVGILVMKKLIEETCPSDLARCILKTPVVNGYITDTSTSDLRIAAFSRPLMECIAEVLAATTNDEVARNRLKVLKEYIERIHQPYIMLGGAKEILKMNGLASGAFLHEVATAVATTIPVLSAMDSSLEKNPKEVLGRVAAILPQ